MVPNPLKLCDELLSYCNIEAMNEKSMLSDLGQSQNK